MPSDSICARVVDHNTRRYPLREISSRLRRCPTILGLLPGSLNSYISIRISLPNAVTDHVSRAAYGMKQRALETLVDLGTQPRNMHVDDVGLRIEMIVPD